jgi:hypothetical protein
MKIPPVVFAILLASCAAGREEDRAVRLPQLTPGAEAMSLQRCLLLGPFEAKLAGAAVDVDFLSGLGRTEEPTLPFVALVTSKLSGPYLP